jgi:hypothetical protein
VLDGIRVARKRRARPETGHDVSLRLTAVIGHLRIPVVAGDKPRAAEDRPGGSVGHTKQAQSTPSADRADQVATLVRLSGIPLRAIASKV